MAIYLKNAPGGFDVFQGVASTEAVFPKGGLETLGKPLFCRSQRIQNQTAYMEHQSQRLFLKSI